MGGSPPSMVVEERIDCMRPGPGWFSHWQSSSRRAIISSMDAEERSLLERWSRTWKKAGVELDRIRREEVRKTDTAEALAVLADAFELARRLPPRPSSGLVEQQALFGKLRRR
jgi:hypothetical protein